MAMPRSPASRWRPIVHGTVGTQHAAMAIYNAYCDRVPIHRVFTGNAGPLDERRPGVEWFPQRAGSRRHRARLRQMDDYPMSLQHFAESTVRGYALACAQPAATGGSSTAGGQAAGRAAGGARAAQALHSAPDQTVAGRRRRQRTARSRQNADRGRGARHHRGSLCALPAGNGRSRQARRAIAGARRRYPWAHEHAEHALSLPVGARVRIDRAGRLYPVARTGRISTASSMSCATSWSARSVRRSRRASRSSAISTHEFADPFQLPGFSALMPAPTST